jgi:hypothetical protein
MRHKKVVGFLRIQSSIKILGNVREIGDRAFSDVSGIKDLSFEERILKVGAYAFSGCSILNRAICRASLIVLEANAFSCCNRLRQITFAVGSQLQRIRSEAFSGCPLKEVVIPASIVEIDPSAFSDDVGRRRLRFEGPPLFLLDCHFIRSLNSAVLFRDFSDPSELFVRSDIEVIGANAYRKRDVYVILFETGARLREIGAEAFGQCSGLAAFNVPESVEIIGDRCFADCVQMAAIEFERRSRLKRIGERAFARCGLHSITIPALTEEIDGSAFVNCPFITIQVTPGSLNFKVEGAFLVTSDGTELVRYFGHDPNITIENRVKVLRKSCFEGCKHMVQIDFDLGSELERIGPALRDCASLVIIDIHASVTIVDEASFEGCDGLESCVMDGDPSLVTIGARAFANCRSLRSFDIPLQVGEIGSKCFNNCIHLYRLQFRSSECLKRVIGDRLLDDALNEFGLRGSSTLFRIEVEDGGGVELKLPGWSCVCDGEGDLELSLIRNIQ